MNQVIFFLLILNLLNTRRVNTYDSDDDTDKVGKNETEIVAPIKTLKQFLEKAKYTIN